MRIQVIFIKQNYKKMSCVAKWWVVSGLLVANSGDYFQVLYNWLIDDSVYIDYMHDLSEMCLHHGLSLFVTTY